MEGGKLRSKAARLFGSIVLTAGISLSTSVWLAHGSQHSDIAKIFLGPDKVPFCMPSKYVSGISQLSDGSWRLEATMFLPDFSTEAVYDKLHPITPSPVFQSPERIAFEHSILQIEVTSSYQGKNDPTGEISQNQGMKNSLQIDHPSTNNPIYGFKEYDDKWGNPDVYFDVDGKPRFITCFGNACGIGEILDHSISVEIRLDKVAVARSMYILANINEIIKSTKCT